MHWIVTAATYAAFAVAIVAIACLLAAEYLGRRFTCVYDIDKLGRERRPGQKGAHAVVLGGGLAGVLSARVLLDHFEHVTIIEGDEYDKEKERVRAAVPQGAHAHILLAIGNHTMQALFRGIEAVFSSRGGRVQDLGSAMKWFYWASFRVRCKMDYPFWCSTRPFLDKVVRDTFYEQYGSRVTVRTRSRVVAPVLSTDLASLESMGVPIVGGAACAHPPATSEEFRIVGVQIKRKGGAAGGAGASSSTPIPDEPEEASGLASTTVLATVATARDGGAGEETKAGSGKGLPNGARHDVLRTVTDREGKDTEIVLGDLVVDCSGSNCLGERWAKKWGIAIPTSEIKATSMYVSHLFKEPPDFKADWVCAPVYPTPGLSSRFGYLMRVENGIWQVTGMGTAKTAVDNSSLESFINHFKLLDNPLIYDLLTTPSKATGLPPQPLDGESLHTYAPNVYMRRHYELCEHWPEGLVAVGNSACIFDPMYGQGMSGACIAALSLNKALQRSEYSSSAGTRRNGLARAYHDLLADRLAFPWALCVGEDRRWSAIQSHGPSAPENLTLFHRALQFWIRQGMVLAQHYPLAQRTAMGIMNMTISFTTLLYPPLVYLVFKNVLLESLGMTETPEDMWRKIQAEKEKEEMVATRRGSSTSNGNHASSLDNKKTN